MPGALMLMMGSGGGAVVSLPATVAAADFTVGSVGYDAYVSLENDSDVISYSSTGGAVDIGDWVAPRSAAGAAYECRMTTTSGTLTSGTTGSWLALSTTRTWRKTAAGVSGYAAYVGTLEIRDAVTLSVLASRTVTIEGQADF